MSRVTDPRLLEQLEKEITGWQEPPLRLIQALRNNEFELFAQPIVSLAEPRRIAMAEVLVRLREEENALLPPGMFLPVFEFYGMMNELDRWVARQVVARLARGSRVPCLTVNVSAQTMGDAEFVPQIAAELARAKVPPSALAFEVDEEDLLALPASAQQFAAAVRQSGITLILDSFGRTVASFRPLRELRANYVKVDGIIVRNLETSHIARNKLEAIVRIADLVGVQLIGSCVETPGALTHLKAARVGLAQGFGVQAPVPIAELL